MNEPTKAGRDLLEFMRAFVVQFPLGEESDHLTDLWDAAENAVPRIEAEAARTATEQAERLAEAYRIARGLVEEAIAYGMPPHVEEGMIDGLDRASRGLMSTDADAASTTTAPRRPWSGSEAMRVACRECGHQREDHFDGAACSACGCAEFIWPEFPATPAPQAEGLDVAWAEAEAALPDGAYLVLSDDPRYSAEAVRVRRTGVPEFSAEAEGDTPAAALHALAERLRAYADQGKPGTGRDGE